MNIYITRENEERLRNMKGDVTMSGLINVLLDQYFTKVDKVAAAKGEEK